MTRTTRLAGRAILLGALCASVPAVAAPPEHGPLRTPPTTQRSDQQLSNTELQILAHVAKTDDEEVELGQLAQEHASSPEVKRYGEMLVEDHGRNGREIREYVGKHRQALPEVRPTDDVERVRMQRDEATAAKLRELTGPAFDRAFLRAMITGHDAVLAELGTDLGKATNPELVTMLRTMQPVLEKHRDAARELMSRMPRG